MPDLRRILPLLLIWAAILPLPNARAAQFVPPENPPRFLFVVDKSRNSELARIDLSQTMFDLVYRGANGFLPDGAVFEIWVFGEATVYRGFNPEMRTPSNHLPLASHASGYVRDVTVRGEPNFEELLRHLSGAAELAQELTVILLTSPDTRVAGTPFDAELNTYFDAQAEAQLKLARPFITAIRIQDGELASAWPNDSAFTMSMLPMPASKYTRSEREERIAAARRAKEEAERPKKRVAPVPFNRDIPDDQREGAIILRGTPKPPPQPVPTPEPPAEPKAAEPVQNAPQASEEKPSTTELPKEPSPAPAVPKEEPAQESTAETALTPPAAESQAVAASAVPTAPPTNSPAQVAVTLPPKTWFTAGGLFVAGLCFFVVAALLGWVLMRRTRAARGPSYITRSIDNRRE